MDTSWLRLAGKPNLHNILFNVKALVSELKPKHHTDYVQPITIGDIAHIYVGPPNSIALNRF